MPKFSNTLTEAQAISLMNKMTLKSISEPFVITPLFIHCLEESQTNSGIFLHFLHSHAFFEMHIPIHSTINYSFENSEAEVGRHQFIIISPGVKHCLKEAPENYAKYGIAFILPKDNENEYNKRFSKLLYSKDYFVGELNDAICTSLSQSITECCNPTFYTPYVVSSIVAKIVISAIDMMDEHGSAAFEYDSNPFDQRFIEAKRFINDNICSNIKCTDIATQVHLSTKQLNRLFLRYEAMTTYKYIENCKFERARMMLCETNLSMKEISTIMGFNTQHHFNSYFKRLSGYPPNKYRIFFGK